MRARLAVLYTYANASYWFLPALITLGGVILALVTTALDNRMNGGTLQWFGGLFEGGPEDARQLFNTVAGAMITVAGVTFSLAILVLTLASQQFGPRLLYSFMRDTGTQVVLGVFVATFTYCMLVLRTVRVTETSTFVPQISATTTIGLALLSQGVLIYFIHHVAASIRVNNVLVNVRRELYQVIDQFFPDRDDPESASLGPQTDPADEFRLPEEPACIVQATHHGYIEVIDYATLIAIAEEHDVLIQVDQRIGAFVFDGGAVAGVWPADRMTDDLEKAIRETFLLGAERTPIEDIEFCLNQLVDIAVRALSPAVNDPATTVLCIDQLGLALAHIADKKIPPPFREGSDGQRRLIIPSVSCRGFIRIAFDQIRQYGCDSVPVIRRLLQTIAVLAEHVRDDKDRAELRRQADIVKASNISSVPADEDRNELSYYYREAMEALSDGGTGEEVHC